MMLAAIVAVALIATAVQAVHLHRRDAGGEAPEDPHCESCACASRDGCPSAGDIEALDQEAKINILVGAILALDAYVRTRVKSIGKVVDAIGDAHVVGKVNRLDDAVKAMYDQLLAHKRYDSYTELSETTFDPHHDDDDDDDDDDSSSS
eukprot:CAMPEP_0198336748 /NCGR_PEP_ID=MMETSP1450-20131203/21576_1 /TAXON_ID=753684 ORGANISM="Madagascaria erythrocladiodes, Strain CCMP3234" /NCGR_SAMPLE_ID=MMETSP1450 /ASSEMBLY_ACC=CAM_ASM_001115 /LENGTH=148 /DNA_ID=CAMNT_0044041509 /DNA_START=64 /DNA_END=507 /DNA_ORIENTATION=-